METKHLQIANEVIVMGEVLGTNNVDTIGQELGYSPILLINALWAGHRNGKFTFDAKHHNFKLAEDIDPRTLQITPEQFKVGDNFDLKNEVEQFVKNMNSTEKDPTAEELSMWLPGLSVNHVKMMALLTPSIEMYELADPKDKKSKYTFLTLKENAEKQWGTKSFKGKKNGKAKN